MRAFDLLLDQGGLYGLVLAGAMAFLGFYTAYRMIGYLAALAAARADRSRPGEPRRWRRAARLARIFRRSGTRGIERAVSVESRKLRSGLGLVAALTAAAPLLGLLGTVQGMTRAFFALALAGGQVNLATLADGIRLALFTTLSGLLVAVTGVLCHALLGALAQAEEKALRALAITLLREGDHGGK